MGEIRDGEREKKRSLGGKKGREKRKVWEKGRDEKWVKERRVR